MTKIVESKKKQHSIICLWGGQIRTTIYHNHTTLRKVTMTSF
jgi:hypothetical protein